MGESISELEQKLALAKLKDQREKFKEAESQTLEYLHSLVGKCFIKNSQCYQNLIFEVKEVGKKLVNQNGSQLLEISLITSRIISIVAPAQKDKRKIPTSCFRSNLIATSIQNSEYFEHEETKFKLNYTTENHFDFQESVSNFRMYMKEISREAFEAAMEIVSENEKKSVEFANKYLRDEQF